METNRIDKIKIIVILGPTATGKSDLAVKLARRFNGEVISADSRQVYKGMDLGSGKITKKEMNGIPHYLLDVASPKRNFNVLKYQKMAETAIVNISKREKLPILCGGTAFYLRAITDGIILPEIKPNSALRKILEKKSTLELFNQLKKIDPRRAKSIESKNPRRLIRAIEIVTESKSPVSLLKKDTKFLSLKIGVNKDREILDKAIKKRIIDRLKIGMIEEVEKLRNLGLSWKRIESFGLEYRWIARYLQKKISQEEMIDSLYRDTVKFSKKQMTWFKKEKDINWVKRYQEAVKLIKSF